MLSARGQFGIDIFAFEDTTGLVYHINFAVVECDAIGTLLSNFSLDQQSVSFENAIYNFSLFLDFQT